MWRVAVADNSTIANLKALLDQATRVQATTNQLVAELTDQLQRSILLHEAEDRPNPNRRRQPDRRRKPRAVFVGQRRR